MAKSYPRIGKIQKLPPKWNRTGNCRCGNKATHTATIEYSYMRDEDNIISVCNEHKQNINFLLEKE